MKSIFLSRLRTGLICVSALTSSLLVWKLASTSNKWDSVVRESNGNLPGHFSYQQTLKSRRVGIHIEPLLRASEKPPHCPSGQVLMILVTSAPWHSDQRNVIRNTWAKKQASVVHSWQVLFLIGQPIELGISPQIVEEQQDFGDILLGNYVDCYRNLTLKVMHGIRWTVENCAPQFILKTDDDCFVNTDHLARVLAESTEVKTGIYTGSVFPPGKRAVIRDPRSKWYVSKYEFGEDEYPPYACGIGYVLSTDVAWKLVEAVARVPFVAMEDAYVGILAREVGVPARASGRFAKHNVNWSVCNYRYLMVIHHLDASEMKVAQQNMIKARTACAQADEITSWK